MRGSLARHESAKTWIEQEGGKPGRSEEGILKFLSSSRLPAFL
jgi:hypothetical protein